MRLKMPAATTEHPFRTTVVFVVLYCVLISGCAEISTDYGKTKGTSGYKSLNGFGALRTSYEKSGFRSRDVNRLSDRVMRTDVIVWTPQVLGSVNPQVTRWFERWLSRGNKTLVYIVPDSGSEADYWIEAAKLAPPEQRLEYRKRAAKKYQRAGAVAIESQASAKQWMVSYRDACSTRTVGRGEWTVAKGPWENSGQRREAVGRIRDRVHSMKTRIRHSHGERQCWIGDQWPDRPRYAAVVDADRNGSQREPRSTSRRWSKRALGIRLWRKSDRNAGRIPKSSWSPADRC